MNTCATIVIVFPNIMILNIFSKVRFFFRKLRSLGITPEYKYLYIGITDLEVEGTWKFLNGEDFIEANSISYWNRDSNEPNGGRRENCGTAVQYGEPGSPHADPSVPYPYFRINDYYCTDYIIYGICEIKI